MQYRFPSLILLAMALLAGVLAGCGDSATGPPTSAGSTVATIAPGATATQPTTATSTSLGAPSGAAPLADFDPCSLLGDGDFGPFVDVGTVGVEDDLGIPTMRQCTWEGTLQDDFFTGLTVQVHAQPDLDALTFDAEPVFTVVPIEGEPLPGAVVVSVPDPDVGLDDSVVFVAFDAGDVVVVTLPWAEVYQGTVEFDALVAVTVTAATRVAG